MPNLEKIEPKPSKIDARGLKNRFWTPPRHHFGQSWCFKRLERACPPAFCRPDSDFGCRFGVQNLSKWRPKSEKCDVEKQHYFCIDFFMVEAWFRGAFFVCFPHGNFAQVQKAIPQKSLRNTGHGDKIKGWRFCFFEKKLKIFENPNFLLTSILEAF